MKCEPRPKYTPRYVHFPMAEHNNTCTYHKDVPNDYALSKGLFKSKETNFSARTEFYFDDKELERDESYQKVYNEREHARFLLIRLNRFFQKSIVKIKILKRTK